MYLFPLPVALAFWLFSISLLSPVSPLSVPNTARGGADKKSPAFVTASSCGTRFSAKGKDFTFIGTNAYWLPNLNTEDDIRKTLANMSKNGFTVVRTWAFNDVFEIPKTGGWLQLFKDGNATFNTGATGIQRLDTVIKIAKEFNIYVQFSLTNNWFPTVNAPPPKPGTTPLPRNYLSNNYGGMDAYVKEFGKKKTHDEFFTNKKIRKIFYKYIKFIVSRYANEPGVFAWELANDARCSSTLPASEHCNTNTITKWHAETAKFIRSIDCNHLITPGVHGFLCPTCPKLFPLPNPPKPAPKPRKRTLGFMPPSNLGKRLVESRDDGDGMTIRGLWTSPSEKRHNSDGGLSVFNGAFGVDSQDILNAPDIDFASFQVFPDSINYGAKGSANDITPPSRNFNKTLNDTVAWIDTQICSARDVGKPVVISAFGIVTRDNLKFFVPVNETAPILTQPPKPKSRKRQSDASLGTGVNGPQINSAFSAWTSQPGTGGANNYMSTSNGMTPGDGIVPSPNPGGTPGMTPNDGLGTTGPDAAGVPQVLHDSSLNQGP